MLAMSLPVSSYEELLRTVRGLNQEARHVQRLASPLLADLQQTANAAASRHDNVNTSPTSTAQDTLDESKSGSSSANSSLSRPSIKHKITKQDEDLSLTYSRSKTYKGLAMEQQKPNTMQKSHTPSPETYSNRVSPEHDVNGAQLDIGPDHVATKGHLSTLYHGTWPVERGLWQSGPPSLPSSSNHDMTSVMSFASSAGSTGPFEPALGSSGGGDSLPLPSAGGSSSHNTANLEAQQLGAKVDIVYGLLAMLGANEGADMGHTLLALSSSPESCLAMRKSGCIPLLVQLVHSECDSLTRQQASQALFNLVQAQPDEKMRRRELRVLKLLEQIRVYCETIITQKPSPETPETPETDSDKETDKHPAQIIANLMKLSFDESHRIAICQLGGLQAIAQLIQVDHLVHGGASEDSQCIVLRRYSGMALTNLTFGDGNNKALLCSLRGFMQALVQQLYATSEDLKQVTASVLRNLSWRADSQSKQILREAGAVGGLAHAAMNSQKESTLKSVLSALWNLSAHCSINKADICNVDGLLAFLVDMLSYKSPSKTLSIIENSGGILRNISSHIAVRDDYRFILREQNCLQVLLQQLRSPSLTVVSNACGTLWNLSAKCSTDQKALWDMGAVPMLRSLTHSKHKMISMGSSAALKNLLSARPNGGSLTRLDSTARALGLSTLPTLGARRQRALEQELDQNLAETCENIEPSISPTSTDKFNFTNNELHLGRILSSHSYTQGIRHKNEPGLSESRESVTSTHSDSVYERVIRTLPKRNSASGCSVRTDAANQVRNPTILNAHTSKLSQSDTISSVSQTNHGRGDHKFIKRYEHSHYEQRPLDCNLWSVKKTVSPGTPSFENARTKYTDCEEEQHGTGQPIDYSQKYLERTISGSEEPNCSKEFPPSKVDTSSPKTIIAATSPTGSNKSKVEVAYGNYAETDLDQPTNYSLRYAEDGVDDSLNKQKKDSVLYDQQAPEFVHEDTVKTYCTEGTPYETPFNFSTATSMSDLRLDGQLSDEKKIDNDYPKEKLKPQKEQETRNLDEKDTCSVEDVSKMGIEPKFTNNYKSGFSSGMISPEKPVNYCEEGTPGYFSRVSSLSSLNSMAANETPNRAKDDKKEGFTPEKGEGDTACGGPPGTSKVSLPRDENRECKMVTFGGAVDYAEETPLMFSRSSSLASLDSVEQHSIHDDRSSIISDFSRRTSGVVSPSELPDSPTQTVPPTPLRPIHEGAIPRTSRRGNSQARLSGGFTSNAKRSVFEDATSAFKDENTPIEFSRATSLSSLTIDDDIKITSDSCPNEQTTPSPKSAIDKMSQDMADMSLSNSPKLTSVIPVIRKPTPRTSIPRMRTRPPAPPTRPPVEQRVNRNLESSFDMIKTYCTEDTPAVLSHAGSTSNLSELSIPTDEVSGFEMPTSDLPRTHAGILDTITDVENDSESCDKVTKIADNSVNDSIKSNILKPSESRGSGNLSISVGNNQRLENIPLTETVSVHSDAVDIINNSFDLSNGSNNTSAEELLLQKNISPGNETRNSDLTTQKVSEHTINHEEYIPSLELEDISDISSNNSADERLLQQCIQAGMDRVTSVAHTIKPEAKVSNKDRFANEEEGLALSDDSYTSADERLLQQCIKAGMARVALNSCVETVKAKDLAKKRLRDQQKTMPVSSQSGPQSGLKAPSQTRNLTSIPRYSPKRTQSEKLLQTQKEIPKCDQKDDKEFSDDGSINSADEKLLANCIKFGIERTTATSKEEKLEFSDDSNNSADEKLLQECIQFGMERVTRGSADARLIHGGEDDDTASITSADERLLTECINLGIQAVTGERPQIPSSFVQQSQLRNIPQSSSDLNERPKLEKRSRSMGFVKYKNRQEQGQDAEYKKERGDSFYQTSNSKHKGIPERFTKSAPPQNAAQLFRSTAVMSSTFSLDSATSLNETEKALLDQCIRDGLARTTGQPIPPLIVRDKLKPDVSIIRPENCKPIGAERDDISRPGRLYYQDTHHRSASSREHRQVPRDYQNTRQHQSAPNVSHGVRDQHTLREQNFHAIETAHPGDCSSYEYQHPAYREPAYTTRISTCTQQQKSNIASRENNPRRDKILLSREEYYSTRIPNFSEYQKMGGGAIPIHTDPKNVQAPPVTASTAEVPSPTHRTFHQVTGVESDFVGNETPPASFSALDSPTPYPGTCERWPDESTLHTASSWTGETRNGCDLVSNISVLAECENERNASNICLKDTKNAANISSCHTNHTAVSPTQSSENLWMGEPKNAYDKSLSSLLDSSVENNLSEEMCSVENNEYPKIPEKVVVVSPNDNMSEYQTCADGHTTIDAITQDQNSDESSLEISEELNYDHCKPRDPDAMIASVDRLTAELVSHASHLHNDRLMKQSTQDTWNDTSTTTTDPTFPSISASAPIIVSIKSETDNDVSAKLPELPLETHSDEADGNNGENTSPSSLDTNISAMTNSTIIANEAQKVVHVVQTEAEMAQSVTSLGSIDLDNVKPPSSMGSLVSLTSVSGHWDAGEGTSEGRERQGSVSVRGIVRVNSRKKILPPGVMVRRAISNSSNHGGSIENLLNQVGSLTSSLNLDCIKPPSIMNEISDMESSMISVASITSEVADCGTTVKTDFVTNGLVTTDVFDMQSRISQLTSEAKQPQSLLNFMATSLNGYSFSDIENINPPSYLNEMLSVADMSLTENINDTTTCDDTDLFEDCLTNAGADQTLQVENDVTEYSDANSATPLQSDFASSSAESTPKKVNRVNKRLTPKQRRQLTKERYKTYTVAAEMVIKEEEQKRQYETQKSCPEPYIDSGKGSTVDTTSEHRDTSSDSSEKKVGKLTPKQRRQEDRSRFQTQILDGSTLNLLNGNQTESTSLETDDSITLVDLNSKSFTGEAMKKSGGKKTLKQKRMEDRERFRTRTIEDVSSSPDSSLPNADSPAPTSLPNTTYSSEEIQNMIQQEANMIVNTLQENIDDFLDCETLSLVSNEDESEHNSINSVNFRTYHKSWGFSSRVPVIDDDNDVPRTQPDVQLPIQQNCISSATGEQQEPPLDYQSEDDSNNEEPPAVKSKPKIVKPGFKREDSLESNHEEAQDCPKGIRGRRKPLYATQTRRIPVTPKALPITNKTIKTVSSNLVKNVSSNLVTNNGIRKISSAPARSIPKSNTFSKLNSLKPPTKIPATPIGTPKPSQTGPKRLGSNSNLKIATQRSVSTSPKTSPIRKIETPSPKTSPVRKADPSKKPPPMERQGTFTKDETALLQSPSRTRIPLPASSPSKIAKPTFTGRPPSASKLPKASDQIPRYGTKAVFQSSIPAKKPVTKSSSIGTTTRPKSVPSGSTPAYNRSPSADRESLLKRRSYGQTSSADLKSSPSNQSLHSNSSTKSNISKPNFAQRSYSNSSIPSPNIKKKPAAPQKEITSKIASLWKKVEASRKQPEKKDTRVWISNQNAGSADSTSTETSPRLIRSSTFEGVPKTGLPEPPDSTHYISSEIDKLTSECHMVSDERILRRSGAQAVDNTKRISRLGSFIQGQSGVPETILDVSMEEDVYQAQVVPAT